MAKIYYELPLKGKLIQELTSDELCQQRDAFSKWVTQQTVKIGNEDKPFLHAFKVVIQHKLQNVNFSDEQAAEAEALLNRGFRFSDEKKEHHQPHKVPKKHDGPTGHGAGRGRK